MQINWSGYVWDVYSGKIGTIPYLEENVYVDNDNKLHLKTKMIDGIMYGGRIQSIDNNFNRGTYTWKIISNVIVEHMLINFETYIPGIQAFTIVLTDGGSYYFVGHSGKHTYSPDFYFTKPNTIHRIVFSDNNLYFESSPDIYSWTYNGNLDINNYTSVDFISAITEEEIIIDSFSYTDSTTYCQIPTIVFSLS